LAHNPHIIDFKTTADKILVIGWNREITPPPAAPGPLPFLNGWK